VLDVDNRTSLAKYSRRHRLDVVIEAEQDTPEAQRRAYLVKQRAGFRQVIKDLKHARGVELAILEEARPHDVAHDEIAH
jgi:hypothetical protein